MDELKFIAIEALLDNDDEEYVAITMLLGDRPGWWRPFSFESIERPITPSPRLNIHTMPTDYCVLYFRFTKSELEQLAIELQLPGTIRTEHGYTSTGFDALVILCRRLAFPCRLQELSQFFSMSKSAISEIVLWMIFYLSNKFQQVLSLDTSRLTREKLDEYERAIRNAGAPLERCWGFIDGTLRKICRPSRFQRVAFSGHKRTHGLKFQAVATPDGLISHFFGPIEGRHHDAYVLSQSNILSQLAIHEQFVGRVLYGDQGYHTNDFIVSPWKSAVLSLEQQQFNKAMSTVRIAVEWQFGRITNYWHFLDLRSAMKVFQTPVARFHMVGVLLSNCHACITGSNQTSQFFGLSPPSLSEYLRAGQQ